MALFGKKKTTDSDVPADLQQYYNNDKSGPLKWILRILALLIVLALLIWGAIWLVHKLTSKDENPKKPTTSSQQAANGDTNNKAQGAPSPTPPPAAKPTPTPAPKPTPTPSPSSNNGTATPAPSPSASGSNGGSTATPSPAPSPAATGGAGSGQTLVNTGPADGLMAGLIAVVTVLATAIHYRLTRRHAL